MGDLKPLKKVKLTLFDLIVREVDENLASSSTPIALAPPITKPVCEIQKPVLLTLRKASL